MNGSHPESLEDLLNHGAVEKYERESTVLWTSLTHLHTNLHMLRQLNDYRTEFFEIPQAFVYLMAVNLFQQNIVIAHRLWTDRGKRKLTLPQFRDRMGEWVRPEYRTALTERIEAVNAPEGHEEILQKVEGARHKRIGHLDRPYHLGQIQLRTDVTIEELGILTRWFGDYFDALTAEQYTQYVVIEVAGEKPWEGELGYVLDCLAARSKWIDSYDRFPDYWRERLLPKLTAEDRREINRIRKRLDMEPMSG